MNIISDVSMAPCGEGGIDRPLRQTQRPALLRSRAHSVVEPTMLCILPIQVRISWVAAWCGEGGIDRPLRLAQRPALLRSRAHSVVDPTMLCILPIQVRISWVAAWCGEGGIRTHGTLPYTRFPSVRLKPLGHLSISKYCRDLLTAGANIFG